MQTIYCHPSVLQKIQEKFTKDIEKKLFSGIHSPFGTSNIKIVANENLESCKRVGWKRTSKLPDSTYYSMVDDIDNPPSWAIYFGLVEPIYEDMYYYVNERRYTMMTREFKVPNWDKNEEGKGYPKFYDHYKPVSFSTSTGWVKFSV